MKRFLGVANHRSVFSFLFAIIAGSLSAAAHAKISTTTALQVSSACVAQGCVVTLTATVNAGTVAVHPGLVYFCDGSAPKCEYALPVGKGQTLANGTTTIKRTLSPGVHHLHAVFQGTAAYSGSLSTMQNLTIAAVSNSATTAAVTSSGDPFGYQLQGYVQGFGPVFPTGTVSFLDSSNGNAPIASAPLALSASYFQYVAGGLDLSQIPSNLEGYITGVATGDFNGDGFQDTVTVSPSGVRVLLGNGSGRFTLAPSTTNIVGTKATVVLVGDFNGDGKLDIAVPDASTKKICVSLGNGDGTFTDAAPTVLSSTPVSYFLGDFNDDGIPDIAVNTQTVTGGVYSYAIVPLLGRGEGTFTTGTTVSGHLAIAAADFDGDGNADLAVQETSGNEATIVVLHGNGNGTFTALTNSTQGPSGILVVATGDFNGDGVPDLAIHDGAVFIYYQGNGDGTFAPNVNSLIYDGGQFNNFITGDFNGDGILDVAGVQLPDYQSGGGIFNVFTGDPSQSTGFQFELLARPATMPDQFPALAVADFTSDGIPDLLAFTGHGENAPTNIDPTKFVGGYTSTSQAVSPTVTLAGTGIHNVVASYAGDSSHSGSVSAPILLRGIQSLNYSNGFPSAAGLSLNGGATVQGGAIQLVNGELFASRGAFATTRVPIYISETSFDFQITNPVADGFAFVMQSNGPNAVGSSGGGIGYGLPPGATTGASITNSVALVFDLHNNQGEGINSVRVEIGGATVGTGAIDLTGIGIDLHSGHHFRAALQNFNYLTLTDLDTNAIYSKNLQPVDVFKALGDSVGYVGFTAGTGANSESVKITNWTYSGQACCQSMPPTPRVPMYGAGFATGANLLTLNGGSTVSGSALKLTNATPFEATSVYFTSKVGPANWTSDFDFSISGTGGDGFTFVLQDQGIAAVGSSGGGLGFGTDGPAVQGRKIGTSLAVKFDLHNNRGEGVDSTGIYFNGASPTVPAIDMSTSRIDLHSGHTFHVRLYLDADFNLNMSVTDLTNYAVFTTKFTFGHETALDSYGFVGFTAGTSGTSNTVKILNWTWNYYDVDLTP